MKLGNNKENAQFLTDFISRQLIRYRIDAKSRQSKPEFYDFNQQVLYNLSRMLKKIVEEAQPESLLAITVGSKAVEAVTFDSFNNEAIAEPQILESRQKLNLYMGRVVFQPHTWPKSQFEIYVGDTNLFLSTNSVAKTLYDDGNLTVQNWEESSSVRSI